MDEEPFYVFTRGRTLPASWPVVWSPGWTMPTSWLAQLAEAGLVVLPMPGVPGLVPGCVHVGRGRRGAALGRTLCLEAYRKGKSRCHLPSDQERQVSFPSARAGAWEAASQRAGWGSSSQMWHRQKTFGQGAGVG